MLANVRWLVLLRNGLLNKFAVLENPVAFDLKYDVKDFTFWRDQFTVVGMTDVEILRYVMRPEMISYYNLCGAEVVVTVTLLSSSIC